MKFEIPRIGWEMDNEGELVKTDMGWHILTTDHGGKISYPLESEQGRALVDHLRIMLKATYHALMVLESPGRNT